MQADVNWTRISEYKHSPNQPAGVKEHPGVMWSCCSSLNITTLVTFPGTVVYREYSTDVGDPYYPVPNKRNKDLYAKYQVCHLTSQDSRFSWSALFKRCGTEKGALVLFRSEHESPFIL